MMAESEFWRLGITLTDGSTITLVGDELEFREIQKRYCNNETFGKVKISGITDTADRAPLTVAIDFESVTGLTLVKLYG